MISKHTNSVMCTDPRSCMHTHTIAHTNPLPDLVIMGVNDGVPASESTHRYTLRETHTNRRTYTHKHREAYRPSLFTSSGVALVSGSVPGLHLKVLLLSEQTKLRPKTVQ